MPTGNLYKRGKAWYLCISTGRKTPSGGYERIRRKAQGRTKAEAQAELDEELYAMRRAARTGGAINNAYPLQSACEAWCDHIQRTVSKKALVAEYCRHARRMTRALGVESVSDITLERVEIAMAEIRGDKKSTNIANKALAKMKCVLEYAQDRGVIVSNPISKVKALRTVRVKFRRALESEELRVLLKTAPEPWRTIWHLFLATGMRRDELLFLRLADLDKKAKSIRIAEHSEFKPKTQSGARTIPLGPKVFDAVMALPRNGALLFPNSKGGPRKRIWMLKKFRDHIADALRRIARVRKRWGLPYPEGVTDDGDGFAVDTSKLDLHALRYTFITELIAQGVDPKSVQYLAGHANIQTTLGIYAQFRGGNVDEAIGKLEWA